MAKLLNPEQKKAITFGDGPLLIIAGAGTGKTTVITERIRHLITEKDVKPDAILALTFTEKASSEMEDRIDKIMPYGYTQMWISTFHSFCDRVLREEAINIGLNPNYKLMSEADSILFLKKNIFKLDLDYFRPLGNPHKFLEALLTHFSRLQDEDITPKEYLNYSESLNEELKKENIDEARVEEIKKIQELANVYTTYTDLKVKEGLLDFSDLIAQTLLLLRTRKQILQKYQKQFQYILVDEFQDTNFAQNELAILLAGKKQNVTVVADDDQCLPGKTLIKTLNGNIPISKINMGDSVLTGIGKGSVGISLVKKIMKSTKMATFITLKTTSGNTLTLTDNHKVFCYVPKSHKKSIFYYVYLMYRKNLGWRLGITNNLAVRLKLERSADAIIGLRTFETEQDARYHELLWSLQYQIPTSIFKEREGVMLQGEYVKKLYSIFNTEKNAQRLAHDLGIDLNSFHYILDAVTRGQSKRIIVNIYLCFRKYSIKHNNGRIVKSSSIQHAVYLQTKNQEIIGKIKKSTIPYTIQKQGLVVKFHSVDMERIGKFAEKLAYVTGGFIESKSVIGKLNFVNEPAVIIPASNILEGLYIPVFKSNKIYYEQIISITREKKKEIVYDLDIDKTHNFIANDIVVHNSIYRWRGAAVSNVLQFRNNFPGATMITLTKNYRSTQEILDRSHQMIQQNNPNRLEAIEQIDKKLTSERELKGNTIEFIHPNRVDEEAEEIAKKVRQLTMKKYKYSDVAILVRANNHAQPITQALSRYKIPYQFLGPGQLFHQEEIKDLISYLKVLYNLEDNISLFRVFQMDIFDISMRDISAILTFSKKKNLSLFETLEHLDELSLQENAKLKFTKIHDMILRHLERVKKDTAGQILYYFITDAELLHKILSYTTEKGEHVAQNVAKFFDKIKSFETVNRDANLYSVVEWIDLMMEIGDSPLASEVDQKTMNAVSILTVHSSKGLEFPVVFLVNLVAERFPTRERREKIPLPQNLIKEITPEGDYHIQEERRLFYVGMTRAKDLLYFTAARFYAEGKREKKVSPFVYEALPEQKEIQEKIQKLPSQLSLVDVTRDYLLEEKDDDHKNKPLKVDYISFSHIQAFDVCPLHFRAKYLLNLPAPSSAPLSFGNSMHLTLKEFYDLVKAGKKPTLEDFKALLRKNWISQGYSEKYYEQKMFAKGEKIIENYYKNQDLFNPKQKILATELPFSFYLDQSLRITGKIDRIDKLDGNEIEIIDYKTGQSNSLSKKSYNLQLGIYALAATRVESEFLKRKPEEITVTLLYLEKGEKLTQKVTQKEIEGVDQLIKEKISEIENSDFKCSKSILCHDCEYKMLCNVN